MGKKTGRIKEKISTVLSIPQEIIDDVPRIVFDSNRRVYIENFKGITEYSGELIRINAGKYVVTVVGTDLEIKTMTAEDAVIEGGIKTVDFS
ncbi:MAG: sporulation protein YqfC [Ruminococcaceae bacterium]|nr:sporulation protein YqfC [Oscillospiraceae bacterium]